MAKIVIIDDDYASGLMVENLSYRGHDAYRIPSVAGAFKNIETILSTDLIVLDIIMESPPIGGSATSGGLNAGMLIYREIRNRNSEIPILAYSACQDTDIIDIFNKDVNSTFLSKWSAQNMRYVIEQIEIILGLGPAIIKPTVFIVHGHNNSMKLELKNYLQNTLHLPEPIILHEKPNLGRTIIEKFEDYALRSNIVFVLLTPDDIVVSAEKSNNEKHVARQNVIFELGYFLGILGRESGRVILLYCDPLELPTDIAGVVYINVSSGINLAGEEIRKELEYGTAKE